MAAREGPPSRQQFGSMLRRCRRAHLRVAIGQDTALWFSLHWLQLPIGLLIYLTPPPIAVPLVMARLMFFFLVLLAISIVFRQR